MYILWSSHAKPAFSIRTETFHKTSPRMTTKIVCQAQSYCTTEVHSHTIDFKRNSSILKNRGKIKSAELRQEVEQGSTFMVTGDLSCIAPILFANVNFMLVYMRKNYATLEINPYREK